MCGTTRYQLGRGSLRFPTLCLCFPSTLSGLFLLKQQTLRWLGPGRLRTCCFLVEFFPSIKISSHYPRVWLYDLARSSKMTLTSVPLIKSLRVEYFSSVSMSCIIVLLGGIKSLFTSCTVDPQVFSSKPINLAQLIVARLMTLVKSGNWNQMNSKLIYIHIFILINLQWNTNLP